MSKFAPPIHEQLDPKEVVRWTAKRRRRDGVDNLQQGFSFRPSGRDGFVYYREGAKVLELYWEMSGLDDSDLTLFLHGLREWILPEVEVVDIEKQTELEAALRAWLASSGLRATFAE